MIRRFRERYQEDKGAALVWVAGMLTLLLSVSAFAVDLGWIYLHNSRLQAAADAAALAGVVNLPGFPALATADAQDAAGSNGFPIAGTTTLSDAILDDNQYQVFLEADVNTFFLQLIGMDTMRIAQDATAEYIKPVRLGSPDNAFGGPSVNFWAAINGQYTEMQQGDPYAARCTSVNNVASSPGCIGAQNTNYRPEGYYYAVEVGTGSSNLSVQFYDGGHYLNSCGGSTCSGSSDPSDTSWAWDWPSGQRGVQMEYLLYAPDTTPNNPRDNTNLLCSNTFPTISDSTPSSPSSQVNNGHLNRWTGNRNCSVSGSLTAGIYVLQLPPPLYEGSSKFGIRATVGSGPAPRVYGLLDMSIHVNFDGEEAEPYLAEVRPEHAGKILEVDIFDLGDVPTGSVNDSWIEFIDPVGGSGNPPACSWTSSNGLSSGGTIADCHVKIGAQRFNNDWLNVEIPIPSSYTCDETTATGCWWKILIHSEHQPTDRTTWSARISGDPVRLVD